MEQLRLVAAVGVCPCLVEFVSERWGSHGLVSLVPVANGKAVKASPVKSVRGELRLGKAVSDRNAKAGRCKEGNVGRVAAVRFRKVQVRSDWCATDGLGSCGELWQVEQWTVSDRRGRSRQFRSVLAVRG